MIFDVSRLRQKTRRNNPLHLAGLTRPPMQISINFNPWSDLDACQLVEADVTPLRVLKIVVQDGVAKEDAIIGAVLSYVPIAAAQEIVLMDDLVLPANIVGFVQLWQLA